MINSLADQNVIIFFWLLVPLSLFLSHSPSLSLSVSLSLFPSITLYITLSLSLSITLSLSLTLSFAFSLCFSLCLSLSPFPSVPLSLSLSISVSLYALLTENTSFTEKHRPLQCSDFAHSRWIDTLIGTGGRFELGWPKKKKRGEE